MRLASLVFGYAVLLVARLVFNRLVFLAPHSWQPLDSSLFGDWVRDDQRLEQIASKFRAGHIVRIPNALSGVVAEQLWQELMRHKSWLHDVKDDRTLQYSRHVLVCDTRVAGDLSCAPTLARLMADLMRTRGWWAHLGSAARAPLDQFPVDGSVTWYRPGDFLSPHADAINNRAVSLTLSLTKSWPEQGGGGALWWFHGQPVEFRPEFNVLYLFAPSIRTQHMVSTVTAPEINATTSMPIRRLAISGWMHTDRVTETPGDSERATRIS